MAANNWHLFWHQKALVSRTLPWRTHFFCLVEPAEKVTAGLQLFFGGVRVRVLPRWCRGSNIWTNIDFADSAPSQTVTYSAAIGDTARRHPHWLHSAQSAMRFQSAAPGLKLPRPGVERRAPLPTAPLLHCITLQQPSQGAHSKTSRSQQLRLSPPRLILWSVPKIDPAYNSCDGT